MSQSNVRYRNRLREFELQQQRHLKYRQQLEACLQKHSDLTTQIANEDLKGGGSDHTFCNKLRTRHMHLGGYIRYLQKKVDRTAFM